MKRGRRAWGKAAWASASGSEPRRKARRPVEFSSSGRRWKGRGPRGMRHSVGVARAELYRQQARSVELENEERQKSLG